MSDLADVCRKYVAAQDRLARAEAAQRSAAKDCAVADAALGVAERLLRVALRDAKTDRTLFDLDGETWFVLAPESMTRILVEPIRPLPERVKP